MSEGYNGWTNYETWKVNLELLDDDEYAEELVKEAGNVWDGAHALREYIEEYLDNDLDQIDNTFIVGAVNALLSEVNWHEIAEHHKPDEWGDSDEAPDDDEDEPDAD